MRRPVRNLTVALAGVLAAAAMLTLSSSAMAANALHTFNTDAQGWAAAADNTCENPTGHPPTYHATGGNPGGYISVTDSEPGLNPSDPDNCGWILGGPPAFSGQLRADYGGTFSFDLIHPAGADNGPQVTFVGTNEDALAYVGASVPAANTWTSYSFPLTTTNAYYSVNGGDFSEATADQVFQVLGHVAQVQIYGDLSTNSRGDTTGFDNIQLSEPGSPLDTDGDGVTNAADECPTVAGVAENNGCPATTDPACEQAEAALAKAQASLKKLKKNHASKKKIKKAKAKVKKAQAKVDKECG